MDERGYQATRHEGDQILEPSRSQQETGLKQTILALGKRVSHLPPSLSVHCSLMGWEIGQIKFYWSHTHGEQMLMRVWRNACASGSNSAVISNK